MGYVPPVRPGKREDRVIVWLRNAQLVTGLLLIPAWLFFLLTWLPRIAP